jgi:hypothetical protein
MPQQQLDYQLQSVALMGRHERLIARPIAIGLIAVALAATVVAAGWYLWTRPLPVGQLTVTDHQTLTQLVAGRTSDPIREVKPRETVVIVETLWHCYEFERTRTGWTITREGS